MEGRCRGVVGQGANGRSETPHMSLHNASYRTFRQGAGGALLSRNPNESSRFASSFAQRPNVAAKATTRPLSRQAARPSCHCRGSSATGLPVGAASHSHANPNRPPWLVAMRRTRASSQFVARHAGAGSTRPAQRHETNALRPSQTLFPVQRPQRPNSFFQNPPPPSARSFDCRICTTRNDEAASASAGTASSAA